MAGRAAVPPLGSQVSWVSIGGYVPCGTQVNDTRLLFSQRQVTYPPTVLVSPLTLKVQRCGLPPQPTLMCRLPAVGCTENTYCARRGLDLSGSVQRANPFAPA